MTRTTPPTVRDQPTEVIPATASYHEYAIFGQGPCVAAGVPIDPVPTVYVTAADVDVCESRLSLDEAEALAYRVLAAVRWQRARAGLTARATAGPYETREQIRSDPAVRHLYAVMRAGLDVGRRGLGNEEAERQLVAACAVAGVELGDYDRRVLRWLAGWEAETVQVLIGIIERAADGR